MPESAKNLLYCSFCGKNQHEVSKLIAGPTSFICDECVDLCGDILQEEDPENIVRKKRAVRELRKRKRVLETELATVNQQLAEARDSLGDVLRAEAAKKAMAGTTTNQTTS